MNFRVWLETVKPTDNKIPNDLPVERLNVERVVELLSRYDLGSKKPSVRFFNECRWGDHAGSVRAVITPRLNVKIQKLHHDREGNETWVMKRYFFIDDYNYAGKEDVVALEIFEEIRDVNEEMLEAPGEFKLEELVKSLGNRMNTLESASLMPVHTVKKVSENEYNLYYYLRGGGATGLYGSGTTKNVMEVIVSLSEQKKTGLIKGIVTVVSNVSSGSKGGGDWVMQPADFEEYFMPSQGKKEIIETIMTALKTY